MTVQGIMQHSPNSTANVSRPSFPQAQTGFEQRNLHHPPSPVGHAIQPGLCTVVGFVIEGVLEELELGIMVFLASLDTGFRLLEAKLEIEFVFGAGCRAAIFARSTAAMQRG